MRTSLPKPLDLTMVLTLLLLLGLLGLQRWDQHCLGRDSQRLQRDMSVAEGILRAHQERLFREARRLACTPQVQRSLQAGEGPTLAASLLAELSTVGAKEVSLFSPSGQPLGLAGAGGGLGQMDREMIRNALRGHDGLGLVPSQQSLMLVAAVPVRNPDQAQPAGVLRVTRPLDETLIAEIEKATGGSLAAVPYDTLLPPETLRAGPEADEEVARRADAWLREREPEVAEHAGAVAFQQLHDHQGKPAGLLALTVPADSTTVGVQRALLGLLAILALGLLTSTTQSLAALRHHDDSASPAGPPHPLIPRRAEPAKTDPTLKLVSYNLSHHLNNALAVVIGNLEILRGRLEPRERLMAAEVLRETWRAADLVRRLQHAASREPLTRFAPIELSDALANAKAKVAERRLLPEIDGNRGQGMVVSGLESDVIEILVALLENATDAAGAEGHVTVDAEADGAWIKLTVTDDGPGMGAETRDQAADLFFTTRGPQYAGLGLAAVDGIVARHGGWWRIVSEPGRGCSVRVELPAWEPVQLRSI